jgi:hypothetical protein
MTIVASHGAPDPHEFQSPMVLEIPIVQVDPSLWNDKWTTDLDYAGISKFHCEGVFIERLKTRATRKPGDRVQFRVSIKLRNPNNNHDKEVYLALEMQNDGQKVARVGRAADETRRFLEDGGIKVEESDSVTREFLGEMFGRDVLPTTKLKITLTLKDI